MNTVNETAHHEDTLIALAQQGQPFAASTSEEITVALALGRSDLLPRRFENAYWAWQRLNDRQRAIVKKHNPAEAAYCTRLSGPIEDD